jgi:hypothetical protein
VRAFWGNLLGYQATWLVTVWSAGRGHAAIGMLACVAFVAGQWRLSPVRAADARTVLASLACGVLVENVLAGSGWLRHAASGPWGSAPAWIVLLWGAFAMTLNHSMAWFARHRLAALCLGAVGGPLAYAGGARGFGAVEFVAPAWRALAFLGAAWALGLVLLLRVAAGANGAPRTHRAPAP